MSVILIAALVMLYLPAEGVKAATDLNVGVSGLNASYEGGSWSRSGTTITGSATGTTESGCSGDTNSATTSTLTLTNNSGSAAVLSFAYERQQSGGTITIDSAQVSSGTFSKGLTNGESVQIVLTSGAGKTYTVSVSITGLSLEAEKNVTTTFVPAANGSFSYNGTTVSSETQNTQLSSVAYKLSASAGSGYKFLGWYSQSKSSYLSFDNPATLYFDENQRITAVFVPAATAVFATGDSVFTDLNEAISYAQSKGYSVISLLSSGTLPAGNYSIPSGKTLLIPFDAANTLYTTKPEVVYGSHITPVHFRTLTMASGARITVENGGSISVGSKLSATGQNAASWNGTPTGPHGFISMQSGSAITLNSGGNLYVYGYIGGSGSVEALSGSVVYETFQIRCWRGGSATSNMTSGVFPMSQYYVQNIEVPLTIHYGATEMVYSSANASSSAYPISAAFIGSSGLFRLGSGSKLTKQYDGATDRVIVDIDGNSELSTFTISGLPLIGSMSTSNFVLPLNSNFTIRLKSGTTKISQDMAVLPGVQVEIDQGAVLQVASGKSLYIYDQSEWGPYAANSAQLVVVGYSTVNGTTAKRSAADLIDAKIDVNGTLEAAGSIYTTAGGANIMCSEGTGRFVLTSAPGTATTTEQATQSGTTITRVSIPITPAKLHNGAAYAGTDDEYTLTAGSKSGTIFYYNISLDKWSDHEETTYTITFVDSDGTVLKTQTLPAGAMPTPPENPAKETDAQYTYTFAGWTPEITAVTGDATYTAVYTTTLRSYTVKFVHEDGTVLNTQTLAYGAMPEYEGVTPEKASTAQYAYTFKGWTPEITTVVGDATYTATFTEELRSYTVKFVHEDGTVLDTQTLTYGSIPEYQGTTPEKEATVQYTYAFKGWTPEIAVVTGDATYTATFTEALRNYTVKFINEDGTVLDTQNVAYGTMPEYQGAAPEKASTAQYTYTFKGWAPEIVTVTGDATYTATFTAELRSYTVQFVNEDGTVLNTQILAYGSTPEYKGITPEKASTAQYTFTFKGWTPEITTVTSDATYTATYTEELRSYTVKFVNEDGTVLDTQTLEYGTMPEYKGPTPEKASTDQYVYTFAGWAPELTIVTGDAVYAAVFVSTARVFTITWINEDGTVLDTQNVAYGTMPEYKGPIPEKASTAQYTFTFKGWTPEIAVVIGDATYTATFTEALRNYTVKFVNEDGTVLDTQTLEYGTMPEYKGATPEKEATAQYTFTFNGWAPEIAAVTGDTTYTATFTAELRSYTVKFVHEDGTVLNTQTLTYGTMPEYKGATPEKESTAQYTYTFKGWTPEITTVTSDATYMATFTEALRSYTVKFVHEDGTVLDTQTLTYGTMPEYKGATPEKASTEQYVYTFAGWAPELTIVTEDAVYTAVFASTARVFTITWINEDGTILDTQNVAYGIMPEYKGPIPEKESTVQYIYTFKGWTPEITTVVGEATYTATFTEELRSYTVKFVHEDGTVLDTQTLTYGTMPEYKGATPEKESTAQYTFTFKGWTPEIAAVTG
ncbi:MAG: hypothetical protein IJL73_04195, partial [Lachnospiraceae bacterium]|nr:hypothetical protein [Lachnospiraceae bacterium]